MNGKLTTGDLEGLVNDTTGLEEVMAMIDRLESDRSQTYAGRHLHIEFGSEFDGGRHDVPRNIMNNLNRDAIQAIYSGLLGAWRKEAQRRAELIFDRYGVKIEGFDYPDKEKAA